MEKCIGCELCAGVCPADCIYVRGLDNPPDHPVSPGRALRLRLRDQLPPLHPLRPVRGGLPDRGHHRVQAVRVLLHQPGRRHLHQGRAAGGRRRPAQAACPGRTGARATTCTPRAGCGPPRPRAAPPTRARSSGRASSATACGRPRAASRGHRDDAATGTLPLREVLEAHLLPEDIPLEHRGMRGRMWRAQQAGAKQPMRPPGRQGLEGRPGQRQARTAKAASRPQEPAGRWQRPVASRLLLAARPTGHHPRPHRVRRWPPPWSWRGARRGHVAQPGPRRAVAGLHPVRGGPAVHRAARRLPGRRAGHRLRRGHRRPVPVRDHVPGRRPHRRASTPSR